MARIGLKINKRQKHITIFTSIMLVITGALFLLEFGNIFIIPTWVGIGTYFFVAVCMHIVFADNLDIMTVSALTISGGFISCLIYYKCFGNVYIASFASLYFYYHVMAMNIFPLRKSLLK